MKRLGTVVGAGVLVLLASACANPQENQEARTERPTATSESTTPDRQPARTPPAGGTPILQQQLDTSTLPEQTDTQVVVLMVETVPATEQMCTMDLRYPKLTAELDAPLNDRKVVLKSEQRKG